MTNFSYFLKPTNAFLFILVLLISAGCSTPRIKHPRNFLKHYQLENVQPLSFKLCYRYGCPETLDVSLKQSEWDNVKNLFTPQPENPSQERIILAEVIQTLEIITGEKTGVTQDLGGTFPGVFKSGQMDCEDEAVNTAIFLTFLQEAQLLRFHQFYGVAQRGFIPNGWPHMACAIEEIETGALYIVDSWFLDHGDPIHILPESEWRSGWKPEN